MSSNPFSRRVPVWIGSDLFVAVGATVVFNQLKPTTVGADPTDPVQVSLGRTVYFNECVSCHGAQLEGQPNWRIRKSDGKLPAPPHDETGHTWHHPDEQVYRIAKMGVRPPLAPQGYESDMPAFGSALTDEEIWAVLAFISSTWPQEIRRCQERRNQGVTQ